MERRWRVEAKLSLIEADPRDREFAERFRASHHTLALMFAMDYSASMISRKTGRSIRSLTLIYNDPLFRELIVQKQEQIAQRGEAKLEEWAELDLDFNIIQRKNMIAAELDLADKLEDARESGKLLPVRDYNLVIADRADRQGHSKHTITHHDHDFGARLDRAISRSREVKQIDITPMPQGVTFQPPVFTSSPTPPPVVEARRHVPPVPSDGDTSPPRVSGPLTRGRKL